MIKPEHIPTKAMVAACLAEYQGKPLSEVVAAALNAWPGVMVEPEDFDRWKMFGEHIFLPLTQEGGDA